jgi:hypothetical protein
MDLIIAIDASGSLRQSGFEVLRSFAFNVTKRYQHMYRGISCMKIGVLLFGNGHVEADGTIRNAVNLVELSFDMSNVRTAILNSKWQRGFTNMAQAFAVAGGMLQRGGRSGAQSAVLVLSDGKVSFQFQTRNAAQALKDQNVQLFQAVVTTTKGAELDYMKSIASQPWNTNYMRIPGLLDLGQNEPVFEGAVIAKFCSDSISPSALAAADNTREYMMIRENGIPSNLCAQSYAIGFVATSDDCAVSARGSGQQVFVFGKGSRNTGECRTFDLGVTQANWLAWVANRTDVQACTTGGYEDTQYFDTWAIKPMAAAGTR